MSQAHDPRSRQSSLRPNTFSPARIFRKRSSNSSITSNGHGLRLMNMNLSRGHKTPGARMPQSQENVPEPPSPRENLPHIKVSIPSITTFSPESPGHSGHPTPQSSALDLTREVSTRSLVSAPDDRSQDEGLSLSNLGVQGISGSNPSPLVNNGHETANHETSPEIFAPHHVTRQPEQELDVYPTWPSKIPRWEDKTTFFDPQMIRYDIEAAKMDYSRPETVKDTGWKWLTHPEGLPYFYHKEKQVITDAYIPEDDTRVKVEKITDDIEKHIKDNPKLNGKIHRDHQRVLVFQHYGGQGLYPYYYFVDHEYQSIFWLEEVTGDELVKDLRVDGHLSETQFGLRINAEYWMHRWLYPGLQTVKERDVAQMREAVYSAMTDTIFSAVSTSPFPYETLEKIEKLMEKIIKSRPLLLSSQPPTDPILEILISQTLCFFKNKRFLDFYGEKLSRLSSDQHLHPGSHAHKTTSKIMFTLTCLLFFSPRAHLKKLREVYVDFIVVQHSWKEYLEKLNQDWDAILILAGVVLAVVVSFLAMPSVDTTNGPPVSANRSPIQLLGYLSVVFNIGSIVIVLMLKSLFYKSKSQGQTPKASKTLEAAQGSLFGLEGLAIVFSLPRVLLIWAIMLFAGAFFMLCFRETTLVTRISFGVPTAVIALICIWSFWMLRITDIRGFPAKVAGAAKTLARRRQAEHSDDNKTLTDNLNDGIAAPKDTSSSIEQIGDSQTISVHEDC